MCIMWITQSKEWHKCKEQRGINVTLGFDVKKNFCASRKRKETEPVSKSVALMICVKKDFFAY